MNGLMVHSDEHSNQICFGIWLKTGINYTQFIVPRLRYKLYYYYTYIKLINFSINILQSHEL